jgi:NADH-quinone oxidoreductase subunit A
MLTIQPVLPILLLLACLIGLAGLLLVMGNLLGPQRNSRVKRMPYESGMDPIHDTRRRFDIRYHLLAIAFLVFDVELLFLYPWAVMFQREAHVVGEGAATAGDLAATASAVPQAAPQVNPDVLFVGGMIFVALLVLGFIYDWRKGIFEWR